LNFFIVLTSPLPLGVVKLTNLFFNLFTSTFKANKTETHAKILFTKLSTGYFILK